LKRDTDADWLSDFEEVYEGDDGYVTDPLDSDTDNDGMIDGEESMPLGSVPIPPSNHSLSFKKFVSGNAYADNYVTTMARVVKPPTVDSGTTDHQYIIELNDPLEDIVGVHIELTVGNATFHHLYTTDGVRIFDDDFGFAPMTGDKLLIVARAGSMVGPKIALTIRTSDNDTDGFIYLISDPDDLSGRNVSSTDYIKMRHDLLSTSSPILPAEGTSSDDTGDTGDTGETDETNSEAAASSTLNPSRIVIEADLPVMGEDGNMSAMVTAYLMDITGVPLDPAPDVTFEITAGDALINESSQTTSGAFTSVNITTSAVGIVNVTARSLGLVSDEITITFEGGGLTRLIPYLLAVVVIGGAAFVIIKKRKKAGGKAWVAGKAKKGKSGVYTVKIKKGEESKTVKLDKSEYAELNKSKKIKKDKYLIVMK